MVIHFHVKKRVKLQNGLLVIGGIVCLMTHQRIKMDIITYQQWKKTISSYKELEILFIMSFLSLAVLLEHLQDNTGTNAFLGKYSSRSYLFVHKYRCRRNAIVANLPFQLIASILMIITLYIYHGYEKEDPDNDAINEAKKNKNVAITLFFISRFLSGFSAGQLKCSSELMFRSLCFCRCN